MIRLRPDRRPMAEDRARGPVEPTVVGGPAELATQIDRHLAQCRRQRGMLALLCVNVEFMDTEDGLMSADLELKVRDEVAHRICGRVRGSDSVLRETDRDACVLLPGTADEDVRRVADRLGRALNGDYRIGGHLVHVAVRIAAAVHPRDGAMAADLLSRTLPRR